MPRRDTVEQSKYLIKNGSGRRSLWMRPNDSSFHLKLRKTRIIEVRQFWAPNMIYLDSKTFSEASVAQFRRNSAKSVDNSLQQKCGQCKTMQCTGTGTGTIKPDLRTSSQWIKYTSQWDLWEFNKLRLLTLIFWSFGFCICRHVQLCE